MLARRDGPLRKADDLAVFPHRRAIGDFRPRNLVSGADVLGDVKFNRTCSLAQFVAGYYRPFQHGDIVGFVEHHGDRLEFSLSH